jgi:hypothetical protein
MRGFERAMPIEKRGGRHRSASRFNSLTDGHAFLKENHIMRKHWSRLALVCGTVLAAASLAAPATAQEFTDEGAPCAILVDNTGTFIEVTDVGTVPKLVCHGRQGEDELGGICDEAFDVCVKGRTDGPEIAVLGTASLGLIPATHGDPDDEIVDSCEPFVQVLLKTNKGNEVLIVPLMKTADSFIDPVTLEEIDAPVYDLNDQLLDLDGNPNTPPTPLPRGSLVTFVIENRPRTDLGRCIGVRTTIQHRVGTCKIWKTRKFFNVCKTAKTITAIKEFELPCACGVASAFPPPGSSRKVSYQVFSTGEFITFEAMGWSTAKPRAGSVSFDDFADEFARCPPMKSLLTPAEQGCDENGQPPYLEVLLDFTPGGATLKQNQEKFVSFCLDFE